MSGDGHMKYYYIYIVNWEQVLVQIVLQKLTIGIWVSTLYGIWKIKPDYETMNVFLQFSEDPIWFGQVVTKKYGLL